MKKISVAHPLLHEVFMQPSLKLPDPDICRTRHDFADYWECLGKGSPPPANCPFLRRKGLSNYCVHAECWSFAREDDIKGISNDL